MSGTFYTVGNEAVAWGTRAATLTRGIEHKPGNNAAPRVEDRPSAGFRPGYKGNPTDTHKRVVKGGQRPLVFDLLSKGHSLALASISDAVTITTPGGGTLSRLHTIIPSTDGTLLSRTVHEAIEDVAGTVRHADYLGCKAQSLAVSIAANGNVEVKLDYNYKSVDTGASSVTPAYASSPYVYTAEDFTVSVDGDDVCQRAVDFTIPTGIKIDRDMICAGGREEPVVAERIMPTGNLGQDFAGFDYFDDWLSGATVPLTFTGTGPLIEGSLYNSFTVTFAACKYTGTSPNPSLTDIAEQGLPWMAMDNGTDPVWKIEYQTTDTAA